MKSNPLSSAFTPNLIEAGTDEVGRGCLAGPVVAAAVILPKNFSHPKLTDSKQLTENEREEIKLDIIESAISFAIAEVDNNVIDQINILNASIKAMHLALDQLPIKPELILVDGNKFLPYQFIPHQCIIKGDTKFYSIAAASVLAKCHRDSLMKNLAKQYPHYGWEHNAGYPTKLHRKAIQNLGTTPYHRMSYKLL
ncbi:MAG: ribonuclease HII [Bacteroidota bacterium]|nr:ribonuclease HII [Bacteroidota bacterium]